MRYLFAILVVVTAASSANAVIVTADADGYSNGTDISNSFSGITLSSVGGYSGLDGIVYAWADGLASTPSSVFANNLSFQREWYAGSSDGFALRADFDQLAVSVSIDIIGDDASDYGELRAYNSSDDLLEQFTTPPLAYGEVYTAMINRASYDIAYIIAGGTASAGDTVHLDNLAANIIPEPATIFLLGLGGLALTNRRKKV